MILNLIYNNKTVTVECEKEDENAIKQRVLNCIKRSDGEVDDFEALVSNACDSTDEILWFKISDIKTVDMNRLYEDYKTTKDHLITFLEKEVEFRLREIHKVSNKDNSFLHNIVSELADNLEEIFDFENLDNIIRKKLQE